MSYQDFVARKLTRVPPTGLADAQSMALPDGLFDFQECLVRWALARGRAAIFADTGLGKSRMQLSWAHAVHAATGYDVLILAPLAVAAQTVEEGESIGVKVKQCKDGAEVEPGITITNYDRMHRFDTSRFGAVVLDESSVIKHHTSKTLQTLLEAFAQTPFKLCATATPAPNDWTELGTHAQFLGICTQVEMLSEYFVHDGGETQTWRLKGHAREQFWRWVASWAALVRKPSDLGFDGSRYELPALRVAQHTVKDDSHDAAETGMLFALEANTLMERRKARKNSMAARIARCVDLIRSEWANDEQEGVQPGLLLSESGQVQADPGAAGEAQRGPTSEVRGMCGDARKGEGSGKEVAGGESGQAEGAAPQSARDRTERLSGHACESECSMRDLRTRGQEQPQLFSVGRSLSQDGADSRPALHELQSGHREVCGRSDAPDAGRSLHRQAWLIWCEFNDEQDQLERHFGKLAFSVRGSMTPDEKEAAIIGWLSGERPVMISKPSIMGWGINAQHCARMAFVGVTDSWEAYYQAVRRCWRFGQRSEVEVHIFASDLEGAVVANLQRKERDALAMADALSSETRGAVMEAVTGSKRMSNTYSPQRKIALPAWIKSEDAA